MIPSIGGGSGGTSLANSESDASAQTSGNVGNSSSDRVNKQFTIIGGSSNNLDLNGYLSQSSANFYNALGKSEQSAENGAFKYAALGAGVFISLLLVIAMKGRK